MRNSSFDTVISNKTIHKNEAVPGPFRQVHLESDIFGQDATAFDANRFMVNNHLSRTKEYIIPLLPGYILRAIRDLPLH